MGVHELNPASLCLLFSVCPGVFLYIASCVTFLAHVWGMRSCDIWTRLLLHNSGGGGAHVVVQRHGSGGFGVVSVQFKVWALHVQWVRRFVTSFSCWMQFLFYYCRKAFGALPGVVLSRRYRYDLSSLPPFYRGLLSAWVAAEGSFSATQESLVVGSFSCESPIAVAEDTTKSVYSLLVANHSQWCSSFCPCFGGFVLAFYMGPAVSVPSRPPCDWPGMVDLAWSQSPHGLSSGDYLWHGRCLARLLQ